MKLSKAQLQYIKDERVKMDQRRKDLDSLGDLIYQSTELSAESSRIGFRRWYFNMLIDLHNIEVDAEKASFEALKDEVDKELSK